MALKCAVGGGRISLQQTDALGLSGIRLLHTPCRKLRDGECVSWHNGLSVAVDLSAAFQALAAESYARVFNEATPGSAKPIDCINDIMGTYPRIGQKRTTRHHRGAPFDAAKKPCRDIGRASFGVRWRDNSMNMDKLLKAFAA